MQKQTWKLYNGLDLTLKHNQKIMVSMLKSLIRNNENHKAMKFYTKHFHQNQTENDEINTLFMKACLNTGYYSKCKALIDNIDLKNIEKQHSIQFVTTVMNYFGKMGEVNQGLQIYENLSETNRNNIVCVNVLIKCFMDNEQCTKAISLYEEQSHLRLDDISHNLYVKACMNNCEFEKAKLFIKKSNALSHSRSIQLSNTFIDFYGKCGDIPSAMDCFESISKHKKDIVSVGAMMKGFINNERNKDAICLYKQYWNKFNSDTTIKHNNVTNLLLIKAYTNMGAMEGAKQFIESMNVKKQCSVEFTNTLIDFYGKIGEINKAVQIFEKIPNSKKDGISINALMKCFMNNSQNNKAMQLYRKYENIKTNEISHNLYMKAYIKHCIDKSDYNNQCKQMIASLMNNTERLHKQSKEFLTLLIEFLGNNGNVSDSMKIFETITEEQRDIVCIGAMMKCLLSNDCHKQSIAVYHKYENRLAHNDITKALFIKACSFNIIHSNGECNNKCQYLIENITPHLNTHSIQLITCVIDFYGKIGEISQAFMIFENISDANRNVVCINAMMSVCTDNNQSNKAIKLYEQYSDTYEDDTTKLLFIKACLNIGNYQKCKYICDAINVKLCHSELRTTLIHFYGKIGEIRKAFQVFQSIPTHSKTIVHSNAMMNAYNDCERYEQTLILFETQTQSQKDYISYSIALHACGNMLSLSKGMSIINELEKSENNQSIFDNISVQSALICMFAKCSEFQKGIDIFDSVDKSNLNQSDLLCLYASIMDCFAKRGEISNVLQCYNELKQYRNVKVSSSIFCIVLNACSHTGSIQNALDIFYNDIIAVIGDKSNLNIHPLLISAMIDCLARSGDTKHWESAENMYLQFCHRNEAIYHTFKLQMLLSLLSSYRSHKEGQIYAERIVKMMNEIQAKYGENKPVKKSMQLLLANIYADTPDSHAMIR